MRLFKRRPKAPVRQSYVDRDEPDFRRSRTLTGSTADSVRSANEAGPTILKSDRIKEHHLRRHRRRLSVYVIIVVLIVAGLGWLVSQFVWTIDSTSTAAFSSHNVQADYLQDVDKYYANRPLERFRFALDQANLEKQLASDYPEVKSAGIVADIRPLSGELELGFRKPILAWQIDSTRYYVDASGMAFTRNYYDEPDLIVEDKSGIPPQQGLVASRGVLSFIGQLVASVNKSKIGSVAKVILPPGKTHEIDLMISGKNYVIRAQLDRDIAGQVADIINAIEYFNGRKRQPLYVDVRTPGQAYYKY